jgi:hypothetical protein
MEHAVITGQSLSHATLHRQDVYMIQIDFSNAFNNAPHELILGNMYAIGGVGSKHRITC